MEEQNNDYSRMNTQQGASTQYPAQTAQTSEIPPIKPANWLWQSIVATILCCLPFGIAGIVFATRVDKFYYNGQYAEAEKAARKARMWTIVAIVLGFIISIAYLIFLFSMGGMEQLMETEGSIYNF